jgi:type IV pilus biogenesis protein CpaD/CtpE
MGYVSYRRSTQLKALDLRLELRKRESDVGDLLRVLPELADTAKQSRLAVAAANGSLNTGAMEAWKAQIEVDLSAISILRSTLVVPVDGHASLTPFQLETKLVEVHALHAKARQFDEKYRAALVADDKERDNIRAAIQLRINARR